MKKLMELENDVFNYLTKRRPETGMNFQIVSATSGLLGILADATALPYYHDDYLYNIHDLIAGNPIPDDKQVVSVSINEVFEDRTSANNALKRESISPVYTGSLGAFPLIIHKTLQEDTIYYRYLSSPKDPRFDEKQLSMNTYLTTGLDVIYANSGLAAVGRYSLPIPLPAINVIQYSLPSGTQIKVGTIAPMFGQSGGGVEIKLANDTDVKQKGRYIIPAS